MKKTFLNLLIFLLIFALFISVVGCTKEEEPTSPPFEDSPPVRTLQPITCKSLEEYEAWCLSNSFVLSDLFVTYQTVAMLGEFARFSCGATDTGLFPKHYINYYFTYTFTDNSNHQFRLLIRAKSSSAHYFAEEGRVITPQMLEHFDNIQCVTMLSPPTPLYVSYNSIQFEYKYEHTDQDSVECRLKEIMWESHDRIFVLTITDYPLNITDTFLGQMLTSFEMAEAGINALNKSMFESFDES